ncbi:MAG: hypothetical protein HXS54_06100 [Theionarchaea archaeon]|nr:hypothetical protein [Theionarchaea archaeon]DBA34831.1 TPA_asm: hypothetical protein vir521_00037 [Caudoviricetes sp. vir521]
MTNKYSKQIEHIINKMNAQIEGYGTFTVKDSKLYFTKKDTPEPSKVNIDSLVTKRNDLYITEPSYSAANNREAEELIKQGHCKKVLWNTLKDLQLSIEQHTLYENKSNVHLQYAGFTEDFGPVFALSSRVPKDVWDTIKQHFWYCTPDCEAGGDADDYNLGWVTTHPEAVEKILSVPEDLTVQAQQMRNKEKQNKDRELRDLQGEILTEFKGAEIPPGWFELSGRTYDDPLFPPNIYGGGRWFVIDYTENLIWLVDNNGADGDDWSRNNIKTGGAGAIGRRVQYTQELHNRISKYANKEV